ncbi:MAG TPA: molybdate ABC transporter permease subunit, partial [Solirubrobacterales bacterium]|nr:molybdate ABC transporter permease subunit [Solirubrobacterales bacterium]
MEAHPANLPAPATSRAGLRLPGVGTGVGNGMVVLYLSIIVLLPLAAVASDAFTGGIGHFWEQVTQPLAVKSLKLTVVCSLIVVLLNAFFGTILAWLLVRDEFPGKSLINAVIDLPFALPTIVASLVLLTLYGTDSPLGIDIAATRAAVVVALM